jgi:hypothetical protein
MSMRNAKTANTTSMSTRDSQRLEATVSGITIISFSTILYHPTGKRLACPNSTRQPSWLITPLTPSLLYQIQK